MLLEISFLGYSLLEIKLEEWNFPLTTLHVIFKQSFLQKPKLFFLLQKLYKLERLDSLHGRI